MPSVGDSVASELVLYAGCMARLAFGDFVSAAADAGFDAITVWPNTWRHAMEKEGLTLAQMRAVLDDVVGHDPGAGSACLYL